MKKNNVHIQHARRSCKLPDGDVHHAPMQARECWPVCVSTALQHVPHCDRVLRELKTEVSSVLIPFIPAQLRAWRGMHVPTTHGHRHATSQKFPCWSPRLDVFQLRVCVRVRRVRIAECAGGDVGLRQRSELASVREGNMHLSEACLSDMQKLHCILIDNSCENAFGHTWHTWVGGVLKAGCGRARLGSDAASRAVTCHIIPSISNAAWRRGSDCP